MWTAANAYISIDFIAKERGRDTRIYTYACTYLEENMYVDICIYICICIYIHIYINMHIHTYTYIYTCIRTYVLVYTYVHISSCPLFCLWTLRQTL